MRAVTIWLSVLLLGISTSALPSLAQSPQPTAFTLDLAGLPQSVRVLFDRSAIVVEAHVQSVFPSSRIAGRKIPPMDTDAVLTVDRVIKGSFSSAQFVTSQPGGTLDGKTAISNQFPLMRPGEHYILLLSAPAVGGPYIERPGFQRLIIAGIFAGLLKVESSGKVYASDGMPPAFKASVDGREKADLLQEFESFTKKGE